MGHALFYALGKQGHPRAWRADLERIEYASYLFEKKGREYLPAIAGLQENDPLLKAALEYADFNEKLLVLKIAVNGWTDYMFHRESQLFERDNPHRFLVWPKDKGIGEYEHLQPCVSAAPLHGFLHMAVERPLYPAHYSSYLIGNDMAAQDDPKKSGLFEEGFSTWPRRLTSRWDDSGGQGAGAAAR